jgi:hypothetical protein
MYFIQEGVVDIIKWDGEIWTTLSDESYFGGSNFIYFILIQIYFL